MENLRSLTNKVKKSLNAPQIFHCFSVICCTISKNNAKIVCSLAVYQKKDKVPLK